MNGCKNPQFRKQWANVGSVSTRLVVGLLVVVLGVLFLISNLHFLELYSPMRYFWAAAFFAIGLALVIERRSERSWQWGIGFIVAGVWTFAYQRRWIDVSVWQLAMPLLMLGLGVYLVRRALTERRGDEFNSGNIVRGIGVLSASEQRPTAHPLQHAELVAIMGGVKLDLTEAQLVNDAASIDVVACMGGIEIYVPSEWIVVSNVLPLMGAFIDKRRPAATTASSGPNKTLTIDGLVLMGGIEIKN